MTTSPHRSPLSISVLAALSLQLAPAPALKSAESQVPVLKIDTATVVARVSPMHYGLMTEEINHSYDGGLYAELIRNRNLKQDPEDPVHWSVEVAPGGGSAGTILLEPGARNAPPALNSTLRVDVANASESAPLMVANDGYWGIPIKPNTRYAVSFYAKAGGGFKGPVRVALESDDRKTIFAEAEVPELTETLKPYSTTLTTGAVAATSHARFVVSLASPGTVWLTLVSLFPPTWKDRPNGNRVDLMQMLADLHPAFLRFPGGNYLEGDTVATRFNWKETIHGLADRPGHPCPWRYWSTDGLGLLEFLEWCEDLNMQPVLAVFAGYALRHELIAPGPALETYVQDALDEIEYVTGDAATTHWGAERAKDGHPAPFPLTYVEIGNEDWFDKTGSYEGRYAQFSDAIKAKYPALQLIATTPVKSRRPDVLDDHFYRSAAQFESDTHHYDKTDRNGPKIFVGEWATREGSPTPNLNAALGDSAWMTGMERNSDLVIMNAYAPLLVNVNPGAYQWKTDLIGYDALTSYGSPAYYAQKLFSVYRGDTVLATSLEGPAGMFSSDKPKVGPVLFASVTRDKAKGVVYIKCVNTGSSAQVVRIDLAGAASVEPTGTAIVLAGSSPTDTNTLADPTHIVPVSAALEGVSSSFSHTFPAYSLSVLVLQTR
jgi:alpha-N-arabinofuranosidase